MGRPNFLHYVTSKAAIVGMTRSMSRELGLHGITVNALMPGLTKTEVERKTVTPAQKERIVAVAMHRRARKCRKTWSAPRCSWRRRRPPSSPGRASISTAA